MEQDRTLELLGRVQAIGGGLVAGLVFGSYFAASGGLPEAAQSSITGVLGLAALVYYLSLHRLLRRRWLKWSVLGLTAVTLLNLMLIIMSTGNLDSAYYSFWLLAIALSGFFGTGFTWGLGALTLGYFGFSALGDPEPGSFIMAYLGQIMATIAATGSVVWLHSWRRPDAAIAKGKALTFGSSTALSLLGSITDGVVVLNTEGKIVFFNSAAANLTGWDQNSVLGLDHQLVVKLATADGQAADNQVNPLVSIWKQASGITTDKLLLVTKNNRRLAISLAISPVLDAGHNLTGAIALLRDISREKEVERQRNEFISTASHEMRTPIAALEGYISLAMNPAVAKIDNTAKSYLTKAHETVEHLGSLFRDLLSAAKAERGLENEPIEPVELSQLVQEVVDALQEPAHQKNLSLVFQPAGAANPKVISPLYYVAANPDRVREVTTNLVDNALKYTKQGGVKVGLAGNNQYVTIGITDTGPGIASEDMPHLFQKFYRADNSATRTVGGTGLGLYLCRTIVERYHGRIWVESAPGKGSTFYVNLPRMSSEQVTAATRAAKPAAGVPIGAS